MSHSWGSVDPDDIPIALTLDSMRQTASTTEVYQQGRQHRGEHLSQEAKQERYIMDVSILVYEQVILLSYGCEKKIH